MKKIPVTVVVASRNEGHILEDCLKSVTFCDEIFVYDLESSDDTASIAGKYATRVIRHRLVPVVEEIRVEASTVSSNRWMLFLDPDERIEPALANVLTQFILSNKKDVALVHAPWLFYFKQKKLKGTMWGSGKYRPILFNLDGVTLTPYVHLGVRVQPGFKEEQVGNFENAGIIHYWSNSFSELFKKHKRYAEREGPSRYDHGDRYPGLYRHLRSSILAGYASFVIYRGYRDGLNGLLLSMLWGWYTFVSMSSLHKYQKSIERQ